MEATYAPQPKSTRYSITPSAISKQRGVAQSDPAPWGKDAPLGRDIERFVTRSLSRQSGPDGTAATRGYDFGEERMWLTGQLVPDHKTIGDFRKDTGAAICAPGSSCFAGLWICLPRGKAAGDEIVDKDAAGDDSDPER